MAKQIQISVSIPATMTKVWECFTTPSHITGWNQASPDWHCPYAENDLKTGGKFKSTMAAKDGSVSFDFEGTYTHVVPHQLIEYAMGDGRKVTVTFTQSGNDVMVSESFDPENIHSHEMQKAGWQAILDSFRNHVLAH
ncbi:MAG: SRPBCC family protein [Cytophagales bacterium]|nr:SRPBCC family protein [Cytophagales bacterium]